MITRFFSSPTKRTLPFAALLLLLASFSSAAEPHSLFDGKSLDGWEGNLQYWRVENGAITGEIKEGEALTQNEWIYWKGEVNDFDLTVEYRITGGPGANSGIQYRTERLPNGDAKGYQADLDDGTVWLGRVYDEHGRGLIVERGQHVSIAPDGRRWSDPFTEIETLKKAVRVGDWNTYRVRATASHVELWINGVLFSTLDDHQAGASKFSGRIAFQLHSAKGPAKIEYRRVELTDLGKTEQPVYQVTAVSPKPENVASIKPTSADGKSLNLDFETGTLDGWKAEGDAWKDQPIKGDTVVLRKRGNSQHEGQYWIGGYEKIGDKGTGTLTSASFEVKHPWASFLIGGGKSAGTRVEIVDEKSGAIIHQASGIDRENMNREAVDLTKHQGQRIFVRLVDEGKGGWGHLNFDDFVFHDEKPTFASSNTLAISGVRANRDKESPVLWHLEANPAKPTAVKNEEAQKLVAGMKLTHGFQAELIAAEPEVKQPIAFAFDERGRLWVAEAYSYPNRQPEGKGKDRIVIFEDDKGDGTFSKRTVFMEGLNLVSGIEVGFGGVWVGAAPQLLFIPKDANDKAGTPQVLLDGFGYQDTHETLNSFCWGPDGWLYGNQGVFNTAFIGKPGAEQKDRVELRSGVWRYHPTRHVFEIFAHGGSNQWGLDYNSNGHFFMTHCRSFWGKGGTTNAIRNGHFWNQSNNHYAPFISATAPSFAPDLQNYLPASAKYDSGEGGAGKPGTTAVYGGHSHVGTLIYNGDNWPAIYRDHLFTHNLHGHQMNQQENVRSGSGYETLHAGYDLMFCGDEHYIPVDLQTGPDGAVYVIDWCDTQHCHNPADEKWDRTNGRIYRVSWKETYKPVKVPEWDLGELFARALRMNGSVFSLGKSREPSVASIDREWSARTARKLIQEIGSKATAEQREALVRMFRQCDLASEQDRERQLSLLWIAAAVHGQEHEAILAQIYAQKATSKDDIVRSWAIQLATEQAGKPQLSAETLLQLAQSDPSPTVRLALASALPNLDAKAAWDIASALAMHGEDKDDRFLPKMIWFGLARVIGDDWSRGLALADKTPLPSLADSIRWFAATSPQGRELLVESALQQSPEQAARTVQLLAFGLKDESRVVMPKAWPQVQDRISNPKSQISDQTVDQLSALFGDKAVIARTREALANDQTPMPQRRAAFDLLKRIGDADSAPIFAGLLDVEEFRSSVIPLLGRSGDASTADMLLQRFAKFNETDRTAVMSVLTSRATLAMPLLKAVKAGTFDKKLLGAFQVRQMRNLHDATLDQMLDATWGKVTESSAEMKATIARLQKAYSEAPLWAFDAGSGKQVFQQVCAVCHTLNGAGGKIGPDLTGSWRNGALYFIENIVDPNAVVGEQYQLNVITKRDGSVISGMIEQESDAALTVRTLTESVNVAKADIKDRQKTTQSLMPPGMLEALPERKVIELLKYLTSKGQ